MAIHKSSPQMKVPPRGPCYLYVTLLAWIESLRNPHEVTPTKNRLLLSGAIEIVVWNKSLWQETLSVYVRPFPGTYIVRAHPHPSSMRSIESTHLMGR
jgi:hypothetical protein